MFPYASSRSRDESTGFCIFFLHTSRCKEKVALRSAVDMGLRSSSSGYKLGNSFSIESPKASWEGVDADSSLGLLTELAPGIGAAGCGDTMARTKVPRLRDPLRFRSNEAEAQYADYARKKVEGGRMVNLAELALFNVEGAFGDMGWLPVITYDACTCPDLVRQFYCNLGWWGMTMMLSTAGSCASPATSRGCTSPLIIGGWPICWALPMMALWCACAPESHGLLRWR
ncbi:hypothetical protein NE237_017704 [Protea cynaroides]|uniref:Uncharacterized protein n=1 Tax=Protea cynaroides TaxID=273540 RepID=A0A9Q0K8L2_9MAGN|nr:hypothetical protein NE237_017704 [Protea cynaroides]